MLKLESPRPSRRGVSLASPLLALAITVVIGSVLFVALGKDPVRGLEVFFSSRSRASTRSASSR